MKRAFAPVCSSVPLALRGVFFRLSERKLRWVAEWKGLRGQPETRIATQAFPEGLGSRSQGENRLAPSASERERWTAVGGAQLAQC